MIRPKIKIERKETFTDTITVEEKLLNEVQSKLAVSFNNQSVSRIGNEVIIQSNPDPLSLSEHLTPQEVKQRVETII